MIIKEFTYPSSNDESMLFATAYLPEKAPVAALQILHGYAEHIGVYASFMQEMSRAGYIVFGADHIGHGRSVSDEAEKMDFGSLDALDYILADALQLKKQMEKEHGPNFPCYLIGHSMGSLIARCLLITRPQEWDKVILMGTGHIPYEEAQVNKQSLTPLIKIFKGSRKSLFVNFLGVGKYNGHFIKERDHSAWTCSDKAVLEAKKDDPLRGSIGSLYTFYVLNEMFLLTGTSDELAKMDKVKPVYFISGAEDAFGGFGEGVREVYEQFAAEGMENIALKLYPEARHEILFESCQDEVIADIKAFLER